MAGIGPGQPNDADPFNTNPPINRPAQLDRQQMLRELIAGGLSPRAAWVISDLLQALQTQVTWTEDQTVSYNPATATSAQIAAIKAATRSNVRAVSANTVAVAGDDILATGGAGAGITVTLPAAAADISVTVKKVDAGVGTVTVTPAAGTIDGAANFVIGTQFLSIDFVSDGTNWFVH